MVRSGVVRLRALTPAQERRLTALRHVAELLDSAFVLPGTSYRIGLDPIVGLIPGFGDLVSPLFTIGVLLQAWQLGVPKVVQIRMLINTGIDAVVGAIPIAGDLFDFTWKSNNKNLELLEQHAYEERGGSAADWLFVCGMIVLLVALAAVPLVLLGWLLALIGRKVF
jgi:hypothetical protein